jgi:predicted Zn finger-like uncharacterized protein
MRLVCPECTAAYDVPDSMLGGAARRVRCARCSHEWIFDPAAQAAAPPSEPPPEAAPSSPAASATAIAPPPGNELGARRSPGGTSELEELEELFAEARIGAPADDADPASPVPSPAGPAGERGGPLRADERPRASRAGEPRRRGTAAAARSAPARMSPALIAIAWALTIAVLGGGGYAAVAKRTDVMRAWPPSERAYRVLGLE